MILPKEETRLFFKLYLPLLGYANQYDGKGKKKPFNEARSILYGNPKIIQDFLKDNPEKFAEDNLHIIARWRAFVIGDFILIKSLKKCAVLLCLNDDKAKAYAVLGLNDALVDMAPYGVGTYFSDVVLLPWKDWIIWDGLCCIKPVITGKHYMRSFTEDYDNIKEAGEIIEHF